MISLGNNSSRPIRVLLVFLVGGLLAAALSVEDPTFVQGIIEYKCTYEARSFVPEGPTTPGFETICDYNALSTDYSWIDREILANFILSEDPTGKEGTRVTRTSILSTRAVLDSYLTRVRGYLSDDLEVMAFKNLPIRMTNLLLHVTEILGLPPQKFVGNAPEPLQGFPGFSEGLSKSLRDLNLLEVTAQRFLLELSVVWEDCRVVPQTQDASDSRQELTRTSSEEEDEIPDEIDPKKPDNRVIPQRQEKDPRPVSLNTVKTQQTASLKYSNPPKREQSRALPGYLRPTLSSLGKSVNVDKVLDSSGYPTFFDTGSTGKGTKYFVEMFPGEASQRGITVEGAVNRVNQMRQGSASVKLSSKTQKMGSLNSSSTTLGKSSSLQSPKSSLGHSISTSALGKSTTAGGVSKTQSKIDTKKNSPASSPYTFQTSKKPFKTRRLILNGDQPTCGKSIQDLAEFHEAVWASKYQEGATQVSESIAKARSEHFTRIRDLHLRTCTILQTLVMAYAGHKGDGFPGLKQQLQAQEKADRGAMFSLSKFVKSFYRHFFYTLTDQRPEDCEVGGAKSFRAAVSLSLTGQNVDDPQVMLNRKFFSLVFFSSVRGSQTHSHIIDFDRQVILGLSGHAGLGRLHSLVSHSFPIHFDFLNEFNKIYTVRDSKATWEENDSVLADLFELRSHPQPPHEATDTFKVSFYVLLYKLYVQLRAEKKLAHGMDRKQVFQAILDWLKTPSNLVPTAPIFGAHVAFHEMSYFYPAVFSFVCLQADCENDLKKNRIPPAIFDQLLLRDDFRPATAHSVFVLSQILTQIKKTPPTDPSPSSFAKDLASLGWSKALDSCILELHSRPPTETGTSFIGKSNTVITYTPLCAKGILGEFVGLLGKYLGPSVLPDVLRLSYARLRFFMDFHENLNIRGFAKYLFRVHLNTLPPDSSKTLHPLFVQWYFNDLVNETLGSLTFDLSFGFFQFLSAMLIPPPDSGFGHLFRLLPGQEEFLYRDLYFLLHHPASKTLSTNPQSKVPETERKVILDAIPKLFAATPSAKKTSFAEFASRVPPLSPSDSHSIASPSGLPHLNYLSSVRLLIDHLPFFDFCNKFHEFGISLDSAKALPPYQLLTTFYSFLFKLRQNLDSEVTDSFRFVLEELETCLRFSSLEVRGAAEVSEVCTLSYRKYAELYFVYKTFLMMERGFDDLTYQNFDVALPLVRTGQFFFLVLTIPPIRMHLSRECKKPLADTTTLCQVSRVVLELVPRLLRVDGKLPSYSTFLRMIDHHFQLDPEVDEEAGSDQPPSKIKLLTLYDAIHGVFMSDPQNNDIFLGLMDPFKTGPSEPPSVAQMKRLWIIEDSPVQKFHVAKYLQLAFRKRFIEPKQVCLKRAIDRVFAMSWAAPGTSADPNDLDRMSLHTFLTHQGIHSLGLLRLFLSYANSVQDYTLIAEFLRQNKIFLEVLNVENDRSDREVEEVISEMGKKCAQTPPPDDAALVVHLRTIVKSKIQKKSDLGLAEVVVFSGVGKEEDMPAEYSSRLLMESHTILQIEESKKEETRIETTLKRSSEDLSAHPRQTKTDLFVQEITSEYQVSRNHLPEIPKKIFLDNALGERVEVDSSCMSPAIDFDIKQTQVLLYNRMSVTTHESHSLLVSQSSQTSVLQQITSRSIQTIESLEFSFKSVSTTTFTQTIVQHKAFSSTTLESFRSSKRRRLTL